MKRLRQLPNSLIFIIILALALIIAYIIIETAPKPERKATVVKERLVEVIELKRSDSRPSWLGGGEVTASQQVALSSQISGTIVSIDPLAIPGAHLPQGALLAQLDLQDFKLQRIQKEAAVIQAQSDLDIELGQGRVALQDYKRSKKSSRIQSNPQDKALVLREPQKNAKQAALLKAQADLDSAQLNVQRTHVKMPFNGQILSRSLSIGSQVNTSTVLFNIADSDEYWLQVKVAKQLLPLLDLQHEVLIGKASWAGKVGESDWHSAKILHVLPQVDLADRQAKLLIAIDKPLSLSPSILIGDYLDVRLFAHALADSYKVPSQYLSNENSVWVVNDEKLYKRNVEVQFEGREFVWISSGFETGDTLLTSKLGTITEGTAVRLNKRVN